MIPLPRTQSHKVTKSLQQATNTLLPASEQDCPETPFLCISGETFPTAFALNLHIAGAPPGRGHDWTPESRPRLGFNIIIFDPNHPNPFKGMVMALSERAPSHNIDHEHSTSIEEQAVAAALNALSQIGSHKTEYIISSDSLACLMEAEVSSVLVLHVFHQNDCHRPQRPTWVVRMVVDPVSSPNATCPPALVTLNMCINLSFHYATCASI